MFTGIIKEKAELKKVLENKGSLFIEISTPKGLKFKLGESVSINGVCSTVRKISKKTFEVEYMKETKKKTTVGKYREGDILNLETSLKMSDLLDGHIVSGHVDTVGKMKKIWEEESTLFLRVEIPKKFSKFIAPKGSVALNGVSMTVIDVGSNSFSVGVVNYTKEHTNLGILKERDLVNVETDILAKYISRLIGLK